MLRCCVKQRPKVIFSVYKVQFLSRRPHGRQYAAGRQPVFQRSDVASRGQLLPEVKLGPINIVPHGINGD